MENFKHDHSYCSSDGQEQCAGKDQCADIQNSAETVESVESSSGTWNVIVKKCQESNGFKTPGKKRLRKRTPKNSRKKTYDDFIRCAIRRKLHDFFRKNTPPTLNQLRAVIHADQDMPNISKTTLHILLKEM